MKKIAIYVRVSTEEQKEHGHSIYQQIDILKNKVLDLGLDPNNIEVYNDAGYSSLRLDRPAYINLIKDCEAGIISHVLCYKLDRLNRNISAALGLLYRLDELDIKVYTHNEKISFEVPENELAVLINTVFAYYEQRVISARTKDGIEGGLKKGRYSFARVPFGYKRTKKNELVFSKDKDTVFKIVDLYTKTDYSVNKICNILNVSHNIVTAVLEKEIYRGVKTYRDVEYPITKDIYVNEKQNKIIENKLKLLSKSGDKNIFLFKDKLFCLNCGQKLTTDSSYKKETVYLYYVCKNPECTCKNKYVNEDKLTSTFYKVTRRLYAKNTDEMLENQSHNFKEKVNSLKKQITSLDKKIDKIYSLYLNYEISETAFNKKKSVLINQKNEAEEILDDLLESVRYNKLAKSEILEKYMKNYYINPQNPTHYFKMDYVKTLKKDFN